MSAHRDGFWCYVCERDMAWCICDPTAAPTSATNAVERPVSETSATDGQERFCEAHEPINTPHCPICTDNELAALKASNEAALRLIAQCESAFNSLAKESVARNDDRHIGFVLMGDKCRALLDAAPTATTDKDSVAASVTSKTATPSLSVDSSEPK